MSFAKGLKIGLFLIILGLAMLHASRTITLCGGILQTAASQPAQQTSVTTADDGLPTATPSRPLND